MSGISPICSNSEKPKALLFGISFVFLFVFDSVFTLFRRIARGEKVWKAHRSHIYQRLVIGGLSHSQVTAIYGCTSLLNVLLAISSNTYKFLLMFIPLSALCVFALACHLEPKK